MAKFFQRPKKKKFFFFYGGRDPGRGVSGKWSSCSPLLLIRPYDPKIFFSTSQKKKFFFLTKKKKNFSRRVTKKKIFFWATKRPGRLVARQWATMVGSEPWQELLNSEHFDVVALQELKEAQTALPAFPGYTPFLRKRTQRRTPNGSLYSGGGIATLVHTSHQASLTWASGEPSVTERLDVRVTTEHREYTVTNLYRPGGVGSSADDLRVDDFSADDLPSDEDSIILGDFNVHHPAWDLQAKPDAKGSQLHQWSLRNAMQVLNCPNTVTRFSGTVFSSPDITLVHRNVEATWTTLCARGSDHLPILVTVQPPTEGEEVNGGDEDATVPEHLLRWCWSRADWEAYTAELERYAPKAHNWGGVDAVNRFTGLCKNIAEKHIPLSHHTSTPRVRKSWFTPQVHELLQERNAVTELLLSADETERDVQAEKLKELKVATSCAIMDAKQQAWVRSCNAATPPPLSSTFRRLKELSGDRVKPITKAVATPEGPLTNTPQEKANTLARYFAAVSGDGTPPSLANPQRTARRNNTQSAGYTGAASEAPFTLPELDYAMSSLKLGKAPGLDEMHNELLLHLGPKGRDALLHVLNLSWCKGELPTSWLQSNIVPIAKNGKDASIPASYRPISLTSNVCKLLEKMVKCRITQMQDSPDLPQYRGPHRTQAGFRRRLSTIDQLAALMQRVNAGKNRPTIALFFDVEKAFDTVSRKRILQALKHKQHLPPRYLNWIEAFTSDRSACVSVDGAKSAQYVMRAGVPQGTVLSPLLFLAAMDEVAEALDDLSATYPTFFADNMAVTVQGETLGEVQELAQAVINRVTAAMEPLGMRLSSTKTVFTFFGTRNVLNKYPLAADTELCFPREGQKDPPASYFTRPPGGSNPPGGRVNLAGGSGPSRQVWGPSRQVWGPSRQVWGPSRQVWGPSRQVWGPSRQVWGPSRQVWGPSRQVCGPSRQVCGPSRQVCGPSRQVWGPSRQVWGPSRQVWGPSRQVCGPSRQVCGPSRQVWGPSRQVWGPSRQVWGPSRQLFGPSRQVFWVFLTLRSVGEGVFDPPA